jgi:hypothetical protein
MEKRQAREQRKAAGRERRKKARLKKHPELAKREEHRQTMKGFSAALKAARGPGVEKKEERAQIRADRKKYLTDRKENRKKETAEKSRKRRDENRQARVRNRMTRAAREERMPPAEGEMHWEEHGEFERRGKKIMHRPTGEEFTEKGARKRAFDLRKMEQETGMAYGQQMEKLRKGEPIPTPGAKPEQRPEDILRTARPGSPEFLAAARAQAAGKGITAGEQAAAGVAERAVTAKINNKAQINVNIAGGNGGGEGKKLK